MFKYQNNDFFTETKIYVFLDEVLNRFIISKVHFYNSDYYTNESCKFKCTSLKCCDFARFKYKIITLNHYIGEIIKPLPELNCIGIKWYQGQKNVPHYWQNINDVKIIL